MKLSKTFLLAAVVASMGACDKNKTDTTPPGEDATPAATDDMPATGEEIPGEEPGMEEPGDMGTEDPGDDDDVPE